MQVLFWGLGSMTFWRLGTRVSYYALLLKSMQNAKGLNQIALRTAYWPFECEAVKTFSLDIS